MHDDFAELFSGLPHEFVDELRERARKDQEKRFGEARLTWIHGKTQFLLSFHVDHPPGPRLCCAIYESDFYLSNFYRDYGQLLVGFGGGYKPDERVWFFPAQSYDLVKPLVQRRWRIIESTDAKD